MLAQFLVGVESNNKHGSVLQLFWSRAACCQGTMVAHNSPNKLGGPLEQLVTPPDCVYSDRLGRGSKAILNWSFLPM